MNKSALVATALLLALGSAGFAQTEPPQAAIRKASSDGLWNEAAESSTAAALAPKIRLPRAYRLFEMDDLSMGRILGEAVNKNMVRAGVPEVMSLPMPDGSYVRVAVEETPLLSPELQSQNPQIRTYAGRGIDDPTIKAQLDRTPLGFHGQLTTGRGTVLIDPLDAPRNVYMSFWSADAERAPWQCSTPDGGDPLHGLGAKKGERPMHYTNPSGGIRRTYRLAVSATGEYTEANGGTDAGARAAITTRFNRVRGIFENETNISFNLVRFNIFLDKATDPFSGVDKSALMDENQASLDANNMFGSYDIGHIMSAGGNGGVARTGSGCGVEKAKGVTASGGDVITTHEIGHQLGASHTWNGVNGACTAAQRRAGSAYEPGSGSTIMAYPGLCDLDDVQSFTDEYFHVHSLDQITDFRTTGAGSACGIVTLVNPQAAPNVSAGPDFTIPRDTPFTLRASGNGVSYAWEQFDLGPAAGLPDANDTLGPLVRSRMSNLVIRTIPRISTILGTTFDLFEKLPFVDRTMQFRATARNNQGGTTWDDMTLNVAGEPFRVTYPTNALLRTCGAPQDITWVVGGGSVAPNVGIWFSSDNGGDFTELVASTPNNGVRTVNLPKVPVNDTARVMVEAKGNIFFSVSNRFSIVDIQSPTVTAPPNVNAECTMHTPFQGASPALGTATATDLCDDSVFLTDNRLSVFPLGTTPVTYRGTDNSLNFATDTQNVTVVDTTAPSLTVPANVVQECTGSQGTPASIGIATTGDACWANVTLSNDGPALYPLGPTTVNWTARDGSNNSRTAGQIVTIRDTTPPNFTVTVTPDVLFPFDHTLRTIRANITITDTCDAAPTVRLISITSNEPDNGVADGNTVNDIQGAAFGTDDREFLLRAERDGRGKGRTYTITYQASDQSGNTTTKLVTVFVPVLL